eukprot:TRINITY_DN793_c1_g1_i1.p1 TRINITY_DN793_c1_g1~~TRINITY_DN793_c1_g1_i1.p1  ORF type:complete len:839 (+),score=244.60 TRINITY_DN793_c1_g1_i1:148-2664(+)
MSSSKKTHKRSFSKEKEEVEHNFDDLKLEDEEDDEVELNSDIEHDEDGSSEGDWYDFGSEGDQSDSNISDEPEDNESDSLDESEAKYLSSRKNEHINTKPKQPSTTTTTTRATPSSSSSQKNGTNNNNNNNNKEKNKGEKGKQEVAKDGAKNKKEDPKPNNKKGSQTTKPNPTQPTKQKSDKEEKDNGTKSDKNDAEKKNEKGKQKVPQVKIPASHRYTKALTGIEVNPEDNDDSSEDESMVNTIGNVPLWWYDDYDHIGYDREGNKVMKEARKDLLDQFLDQSDNPNYWRTVYDEINGKSVVLSDEQMQLVKDTLTRRFPEGFDPFPDFFDLPVDDEGNMTMKSTLSYSTEPRSRFIPLSYGERKKIRNYTIALRKGWIKLNPPKKPDQFFDTWEKREPRTKGLDRIPPPKLKLPDHIESYNPPAEYLPTQKTLEYWEELDESERPYNYMPTKHERMADVPTYENTQNELFQRCLDLYLAPRLRVMRRHFTDPNELLPDLPAPKDLRPFPTTEAMKFVGHKGRIRSISIHPSGEWLASGGNDRMLRVWEVTTGRLMGEWDVGGKIYCVAWNPNPSLHLIACGVENKLVFVTPSTTHGGNFESYSRTEVLLSSKRVIDDEDKTKKEKEAKVKWEFPDEHTEFVPPKPEENPDVTHSDHVYDTRAFEPDDETDETKFNTTTKPKTNPKPAELHKDIRLQIKHESDVKVISWHPKGDYLATLMPDAKTNCLYIHQLSRRISQVIFKKNKGSIQAVTFHPFKPHLFVASKKTVRVYDLLKQKIMKRLIPDCKWIASIDVHPKGDNLIVSTFDRKVFWFDLELSTKPYKKLRYHKIAVRKVV